MHAGGYPLQGHSVFHQRNGRIHADFVNVAFALHDVTEADGGVRESALVMHACMHASMDA